MMEQSKTNRELSIPWPVATGMLCLLLVVLLGANYPSALLLVELWWESSTYGHGFLILPISLYLIHGRRAVLSSVLPVPHLWGLVALAGISIIWWAAIIAGVQIVQMVCVVVAGIILVWAILGVQVTKFLIFPLSYLFFAVPVWDIVSPVLQELTAVVTTELVRLTGIPVLLEGHYITVPAGNFHIMEYCSGLRFFLAGLALGSLYAYLHFHDPYRRLFFVLITTVAVIVLNWIRVYVVIMAGQLTEMQHWLVESHENFGWFMFALVIIPLFWFGGRLGVTSGGYEELKHTYRKYGIPVLQEQKPVSHASGNHPDAPVAINWMSRGRVLLLGAVSIAFIILIPLGVRWADSADSGKCALAIPFDAPAGWHGPFEVSETEKPVFNGADGEVLTTYARGEQSVIFYAAYYRSQRQGKELILYSNSVYAPGVWRRLNTATAIIQHQGSQSKRVMELELHSSSGAPRVSWYWYHVAGRFTTSPYLAKALQVWGLLTGRTDASVIAVATDHHSDINKARRILRDFVNNAGTILEYGLPAHSVVCS